MSGREFVYIGFKSCGCGVAVCVDDPSHKRETAKTVAGYLREGLTIERVTMAEYPNRFKGCKCDKVGEMTFGEARKAAT